MAVEPADDVEIARQRWFDASARATGLASELFQPGSGYGDPGAMAQDQHRLESARAEADHLFREYQQIDRRAIDLEMMQLQRSQRLAAWCSLAVAFVVGLATIVSIIIAINA